MNIVRSLHLKWIAWTIYTKQRTKWRINKKIEWTKRKTDCCPHTKYKWDKNMNSFTYFSSIDIVCILYESLIQSKVCISHIHMYRRKNCIQVTIWCNNFSFFPSFFMNFVFFFFRFSRLEFSWNLYMEPHAYSMANCSIWQCSVGDFFVSLVKQFIGDSLLIFLFHLHSNRRQLSLGYAC